MIPLTWKWPRLFNAGLLQSSVIMCAFLLVSLSWVEFAVASLLSLGKHTSPRVRLSGKTPKIISTIKHTAHFLVLFSFSSAFSHRARLTGNPLSEHQHDVSRNSHKIQNVVKENKVSTLCFWQNIHKLYTCDLCCFYSLLLLEVIGLQAVLLSPICAGRSSNGIFRPSICRKSDVFIARLKLLLLHGCSCTKWNALSTRCWNSCEPSLHIQKERKPL